MFVSKKYHLQRIKELEDFHLSEIYHFESRISDLKAQIEDLKKLIFVPKAEISPEQYEADSVVSGSDKPIQISEEEHNKILELSRESDLLFSGNYDSDLIQ